MTEHEEVNWELEYTEDVELAPSTFADVSASPQESPNEAQPSPTDSNQDTPMATGDKVDGAAAAGTASAPSNAANNNNNKQQKKKQPRRERGGRGGGGNGGGGRGPAPFANKPGANPWSGYVPREYREGGGRPRSRSRSPRRRSPPRGPYSDDRRGDYYAPRYYHPRDDYDYRDRDYRRGYSPRRDRSRSRSKEREREQRAHRAENGNSEQKAESSDTHPLVATSTTDSQAAPTESNSNAATGVAADSQRSDSRRRPDDYDRGYDRDYDRGRGRDYDYAYRSYYREDDRRRYGDRDWNDRPRNRSRSRSRDRDYDKGHDKYDSRASNPSSSAATSDRRDTNERTEPRHPDDERKSDSHDRRTSRSPQRNGEAGRAPVVIQLPGKRDREDGVQSGKNQSGNNNSNNRGHNGQAAKKNASTAPVKEKKIIHLSKHSQPQSNAPTSEPAASPVVAPVVHHSTLPTSSTTSNLSARREFDTPVAANAAVVAVDGGRAVRTFQADNGWDRPNQSNRGKSRQQSNPHQQQVSFADNSDNRTSRHVAVTFDLQKPAQRQVILNSDRQHGNNNRRRH